MKAVVTGSNRKAILGSCEYGEDAAQKQYERALEDSEDLPTEIRQVVQNQKDKLRVGHDRVKAMRDSQHA
jgi:uncharacterized protein (TIGR02284 family)